MTHNGKWTLRFDCCTRCHTKKIPHEGHGICKRCASAKRRKTPEYKLYKKLWHQRRSKMPGFKEERAEYERNRRATERWKTFERRRISLIARMRDIARNQFFGTGRRMKKHQGVIFRCGVCPDHYVVSPIFEKELKNDIYAFEIFKKEIEKLCRTNLSPPRHLPIAR
jgi:hypothetical protein